MWNAVRHTVDTRGAAGQFILTGPSVPADDAETRAAAVASLNVITAGDTSLTRPDGVNVIALGHLAAH